MRLNLGISVFFFVIAAPAWAGTLTLNGPSTSWGSNAVNRLIIKSCSGTTKALSGNSTMDPTTVCSSGSAVAVTLSTSNARLTSLITDAGALTNYYVDAGYYPSGSVNQLFQLSGGTNPTADQKELVREAFRCFQLLKNGVVSSFYISVETNNNVVQCGDMSQ